MIDFESLKNAAWKGEAIPDDGNIAVQTYYLSMRNVFSMMRRKEISKDAARQIETATRRWAEDVDKRLALVDKVAGLWKRTEAPAAEYAKNPSVESADRFYAAVYGLPENWRKK